MKLLKISLLCSLIAISSSAFCCYDAFLKFLEDELFFVQSDINHIVKDNKQEENSMYIYMMGKKNILQEVKYNYILFLDGEFPESEEW
jgi:hypothetical protein